MHWAAGRDHKLHGQQCENFVAPVSCLGVCNACCRMLVMTDVMVSIVYIDYRLVVRHCPLMGTRQYSRPVRVMRNTALALSYRQTARSTVCPWAARHFTRKPSAAHTTTAHRGAAAPTASASINIVLPNVKVIVPHPQAHTTQLTRKVVQC
jgi:hypothetical protein